MHRLPATWRFPPHGRAVLLQPPIASLGLCQLSHVTCQVFCAAALRSLGLCKLGDMACQVFAQVGVASDEPAALLITPLQRAFHLQIALPGRAQHGSTGSSQPVRLRDLGGDGVECADVHGVRVGQRGVRTPQPILQPGGYRICVGALR